MKLMLSKWDPFYLKIFLFHFQLDVVQDLYQGLQNEDVQTLEISGFTTQISYMLGAQAD